MSILQDVKYGARVLAGNPGFSAVVIITLALGIGANTTVFTLVNAVLFRGLPFENADRIMHIACANVSKNRNNIGVSYPDLMDWRAASKTLDGIAGMTGGRVSYADRTGTPEQYRRTRVTANAFDLIGQKPILGRGFTREDEKPGASAVVLIGHGLWKSRYGADPKVIGRTVRIDEVPAVIIGVMPEGFKFPFTDDLWQPFIPTKEDAEGRDRRTLQAFGRLAPGATVTDARAEMDTIARRLQSEYKKTHEGISIVVKPFNDEANGGPIRVIFLALLGAVGFVLLIACANVANLMLARSIARTREMSVRTALGATRWRVIRQLLIESLMLGLTGGALGLFLAVWGVKGFDLAVANVNKPYWIIFSMDYRVFSYLAGICVLTSILFGLAPAIQLARTDVNESLKEGGRAGAAGRAKLLSGSLVVFELALALVLLVGAGLMVRSFLALYGMMGQVNPDPLLTSRLSLNNAKYPKPESILAFHDRLMPRVASIPGVEAVAYTSNLPLSGAAGWNFEIEGQHSDPDKRPSVAGLIITPDYFRVINQPLIRGRMFTDSDGLPGKEAVIINQRFAARYWPNQDPLGKRIRLHRNGAQPWMTVAGISPDIRQNNPSGRELDPVIYVPYRQDPARGYHILLRTRVEPSTLVSALRREVQAVDEDLPLFDVMPLQQHYYQVRWPFRVFGTLFAVFAGIALVLAGVGIYGVMAYSVGRQTQEIGVRMALGATHPSILGMVFRRSLVQLAIGIIIGLVCAYAASRVLSNLLVQVTPTDPLTYTIVSLVLIATGVLACIVPARRALRVDPVIALRYE